MISVNGKIKKILTIVIPLFLIYFFSIHIRSHIFHFSDRKDAFSPFYNTETATHYRYTKMVSQGQKVPPVDYKAEYPDGFEVFKRTSIFEEYVAGYLHRLPFFKNIPLHRFVEYFCWYFSALSIFGVFLLCLLLTKKTGIALLSTLYYAVATTFIVRTVNGFYLREIFTFPLIALHMYFSLKSITSDKIINPVISSILIFFVMASWQISQFYLMIIIMFPVLQYLLKKSKDDSRSSFLRFFLFQTVALILAGLIVPYLRIRIFIFSLPLSICYIFLAILIIDKYKPLKIYQKTGIFLLLCVIAYLVIPRSEGYSYLFTIFTVSWYKIRYFLQKPSDPSSLSFVVKAWWTGPFMTSSFKDTIYMLSTYLLWAIITVLLLIIRLGKKKDPDIKLEFLLYITLTFFVAFLFYRRIYIYLTVALALDFGFCLSLVKKRPRKKLIFIILVVVFCLIFEWYKTWTVSSQKPFFSGILNLGNFAMQEEEFVNRNEAGIDVINWINSNTETNDSILTRYAFSPPILIYTGRPVYLSPVYDGITAKRAEEFNSAYYENEKDFFKVCKKYDVKYYVYYIDMYLSDSFYSTRYLVNKMNYSKDEAVYNMQFHPERLEYFELVHQNEIFRIFKVNHKEAPLNNPNQIGEYFPCYDEKILKKMNRSSTEFLFRWNDAYSIYIDGYGYFNRRIFDKAEAMFNTCIDIFPYYPQVWTYLGKISLVKREHKQALRNYQRALSFTYSSEAHYGLAFLNLVYGLTEDAEKEYKEILKRNACYMPAIMDLAVLYSKERQLGEAIELCKRAISCKPDYLKAYGILGSLYTRIGRDDLASQIYQEMERRIQKK